MTNITTLSLSNWRSHEQQIYTFDEPLVVFWGNNGNGKTNILEALNLISVGKSWRSNKNRDLIQDNADSAKIGIRTTDLDTFELLIEPTKKTLLKNEKKISFKSHIGKVPSILFAPEQLTLFSGGKPDRRNFFDRILCQIYPRYTESLLQCDKATRQRNALFKQEHCTKSLILPWNQILAEQIPIVTQYRKEFETKLNPLLQESFQTISQSTEPVSVELEQLFPDIQSSEQILLHLNETFEREYCAQRTLIGPHRDDWQFYLRNKAIRSTASRGEERSVLLSLLMAQKQILQEITGIAPIILLDDVFSELDTQRQTQLQYICEGSQAFCTTTHKEHFDTFKTTYQSVEIKKE